MTIEEMKAKGYKRYTAFLERVISTGAIEIWARNESDAKQIFENVADELGHNYYEDWEAATVELFGECNIPLPSTPLAQRTVTDFNEDFYKSEEE